MAMAIGVDRGIHLVSDGEEWDPEATAGGYSVRGMFEACASLLYPALKENVNGVSMAASRRIRVVTAAAGSGWRPTSPTGSGAAAR